MKCFYHSDKEATKFCNNCGKPLCDDCTRNVKGIVYCEDCLYGAISSQERLKAIENRSPNPVISFFLAFVPGLGAVYNGEYMKAIMQFLIFCCLIIAADMSGLFIFGLGAALYYFYTIIDAYRSANKIRLMGENEIKKEKESKYAGIGRGLTLVVIGLFFFLKNLGWLSFKFIGVYWPLILIAIGGYIIYVDYLKKNNGEKLEKSEEKNEQ